MDDVFDLLNLFPRTFRREPICNTCKYRKLGLSTICEQYKRIPSDIQHGKYCRKYVKDEVE